MQAKGLALKLVVGAATILPCPYPGAKDIALFVDIEEKSEISALFGSSRNTGCLDCCCSAASIASIELLFSIAIKDFGFTQSSRRPGELPEIVNIAKRFRHPAAELALNAVGISPIDKPSSKLVSDLVGNLDDGEIDGDVNACSEKDAENLSAEALRALNIESNANMVVEPKTGSKFPSMLCTSVHDDSSLMIRTQVLAGVGIKSVTLMKLKSIKIYAFGLYVKSDELRQQLGGKFSIYSPKELKNMPVFYDDLLRQNLDMTIRLVVHYKGLKIGMVKSAFDTSLRNRLRKIKGMEEDVGLPIFNSYLSESLVLSRGSVINFQWVAGCQFRTEIDGKLIGIISSRDFCRAFFDMYIGDRPVCAKTKEQIGENLGHMLRRNCYSAF